MLLKAPGTSHYPVTELQDGLRFQKAVQYDNCPETPNDSFFNYPKTAITPPVTAVSFLMLAEVVKQSIKRPQAKQGDMAVEGQHFGMASFEKRFKPACFFGNNQ